MSFPSSARHRRRGASFAVILRTGDRHATSTSNCCRSEGKVEIPTLETLCLRSLESSLGKGLATFDLQDLPLGLAEKIYEFVSSKGSRMAHMELLRAFAPVLRRHIYSLDFSKAKVSSHILQAGMIIEYIRVHLRYQINNTARRNKNSTLYQIHIYMHVRTPENLGGRIFEVQPTNQLLYGSRRHSNGTSHILDTVAMRLKRFVDTAVKAGKQTIP